MNWSRSSAVCSGPAAGPPGATGTGSDTEPWRVRIADGPAGAADLAVWATTDTEGTRLHLGSRLALAPTTVGADTTIGLALAVEAISLRLIGAPGTAFDLDPRPLPTLTAALDLGGDLVLDVGPITVLATRISAGVAWSVAYRAEPAPGRPRGPSWPWTGSPHRCRCRSGMWDAREFRFEGDPPWPIIERLAAQLLEGLANEAAQLLPGLLGWRSTGPTGLPAIPPLPGTPANPFAAISLEDLIRDPWRTVGRAAGRVARPVRRAGSGRTRCSAGWPR